jgi:hypothetical protein
MLNDKIKNKIKNNLSQFVKPATQVMRSDNPVEKKIEINYETQSSIITVLKYEIK